MENYTSIIIRKKANSVWTLEDNEGGEHYSNTYSGTRENNLITIKTKTGGIIYNQQPYTAFTYVDEIDGGNSFVPSSAQQLMTNLEVRDFFAEGISGGGGVNTLLELLDVLIPTYTGNGGKLLGINEDETGVVAYDPDNFDQNNKPLYFRFFFDSDGTAVTTADVSEAVNAMTIGYVISAIHTPVVILGQKNGKTYIFFYRDGKGYFGGSGAGLTTAADFRLISILDTTPEDIENDPNAVIIPLVGVVDGDFLATANLTEWDFSDSGEEQPDGGFKTYYFSYTDDGVEYFVRFIGTAGIYGGGVEPDFTAPDFTAATNSGIIPDPTPNLQQVTDVGAITTNAMTVIEAGSETTYGGDMITYKQTGETNNTRVRFEDPIAEVVLTIPAKATADTFAMVSDIPLTTGDLQEVTDIGSTTTNPIYITGESGAKSIRHSYEDITYTEDGLQIAHTYETPTASRNQIFPDKDGTIAMLSDVIISDPDNADKIEKIRLLTEAEYEALPVVDPNTLYALSDLEPVNEVIIESITGLTKWSITIDDTGVPSYTLIP